MEKQNVNLILHRDNGRVEMYDLVRNTVVVCDKRAVQNNDYPDASIVSDIALPEEATWAFLSIAAAPGNNLWGRNKSTGEWARIELKEIPIIVGLHVFAHSVGVLLSEDLSPVFSELYNILSQEISCT